MFAYAILQIETKPARRKLLRLRDHPAQTSLYFRIYPPRLKGSVSSYLLTVPSGLQQQIDSGFTHVSDQYTMMQGIAPSSLPSSEHFLKELFRRSI